MLDSLASKIQQTNIFSEMGNEMSGMTDNREDSDE
jgi:hypothetical protein